MAVSSAIAAASTALDLYSKHGHHIKPAYKLGSKIVKDMLKKKGVKVSTYGNRMGNDTNSLTSSLGSRVVNTRRTRKNRGNSKKGQGKYKSTGDRNFATKVMIAMQQPQRYYFTTGSSAITAVSNQQSTFTATFMDQADLLSVFMSSGLISNINAKILFSKSWGSVEVTNSSSQPIIGCCYKVMARRDNNYTNPFNAWTDASNGIASVPGTPFASNLIYGATPYMSPAFTANFKVVSQWGIHMESGEQREFRVDLRNGSFSEGVLDNAAQQISKWTVHLMFVFWGSTVHDNVTKNAGTAPIRTDYIINKSYDYRMLSNPLPRMTLNNTLPAIAIPDAYVNTGTAVVASNT